MTCFHNEGLMKHNSEMMQYCIFCKKNDLILYIAENNIADD